MEKVDLCEGYWNPQRKTGVATHSFKINNLESHKNADISTFSKKEEKDISAQISIKFALKYRKANRFIKILKLHGKW